jgi:hypothetical protein
MDIVILQRLITEDCPRIVCVCVITHEEEGPLKWENALVQSTPD